MFIACHCTLPQIESGANPDASVSLHSHCPFKLKTCAYKHSAPDGASFYSDEVAERAKTRLTDSSNHHQVFGAAERPVFLAMLDDAFGQAFTDSGEYFEFFCRSSVEVDSRRG